MAGVLGSGAETQSAATELGKMEEMLTQLEDLTLSRENVRRRINKIGLANVTRSEIRDEFSQAANKLLSRWLASDADESKTLYPRLRGVRDMNIYGLKLSTVQRMLVNEYSRCDLPEAQKKAYLNRLTPLCVKLGPTVAQQTKTQEEMLTILLAADERLPGLSNSFMKAFEELNVIYLDLQAKFTSPGQNPKANLLDQAGAQQTGSYHSTSSTFKKGQADHHDNSDAFPNAIFGLGKQNAELASECHGQPKATDEKSKADTMKKAESASEQEVNLPLKTFHSQDLTVMRGGLVFDRHIEILGKGNIQAEQLETAMKTIQQLNQSAERVSPAKRAYMQRRNMAKSATQVSLQTCHFLTHRHTVYRVVQVCLPDQSRRAKLSDTICVYALQYQSKICCTYLSIM